MHFQVAGRARQDLESVLHGLAGDAAADADVLRDTRGGQDHVLADQRGVDGGEELGVLFREHVFDRVVAENLANIHNPSSQLIYVFCKTRSHDAIEEHAVARTLDVDVDGEVRERQRDRGRRIRFLVDDLHGLVRVDLAVEFVVGDLERRNDAPVEPVFTHLRAREVVDGINCALFETRGVQLLKESFIHHPGFSGSRHF